MSWPALASQTKKQRTYPVYINAMSHIKDKILSIEISVETMLYTYMNVYHQTGEQSMMIKTEN